MEIQFFDYHWQRILKGFSILRMDMPIEFKNNSEAFKTHIKKLLHKNRYFQGVRVRVTFFRDAAGLYTPRNNKTGYLITADRLNSNKYELNTVGLKIGLYDEVAHPELPWSAIKTLNSLFFVRAAISFKEIGLDDGVFVNSKNHIVEALASNIFVLKGNELYTPPLETGCVDGVMRRYIIKLAATLSLKVKQENFEPQFIETADEIWLTNAVKGIQWVLSYKSRRYFNLMAKKMNNLINENLIPV